MITRTQLINAAPTIFTGLAIGGVCLTGITAARAGMRYQLAVDNMEADTELAIREAILPTVIGGLTIASFIFARRADKAMIAGLSVGATQLTNRYLEDLKQDHEKRPVRIPDETFVIDPDGDLYLEPIANVLIQMKESTFDAGVTKINKNLAIRGIISLYELYRMFGVKKTDIFTNGLEWIQYIGWTCDELCCDKGYPWLETYTIPSVNMSYGCDVRVIYVEDPLTPICCDAPENALERCHADPWDVEELPEAEDILHEIATEIRDEDVP